MKKWKSNFLWSGVLLLSAYLCFEIFSYPTNATGFTLLGFSFQRILLVLFPLFTCIFSIVILAVPKIRTKINDRLLLLFNKLSTKATVILCSVFIWIIAFLGPFLLYYRFFISPKTDLLMLTLGVRIQSLFAYVDRLWGNLFLCILWMLIFILFAAMAGKFEISQHRSIFVLSGIFTFAMLATFFQWIVFAFELHVFEQIPGWYWPIIHKPDFIRHAVVFGIFFLFLGGIIYLQKYIGKHAWISLILLSIGFLFLQFNTGLMEGRGMASLSDRFFLSYHRVYLEEACNSNISAYTAVSNYEDLYHSMFLQTKPPGVLWSSFLLTKIANSPGVAQIADTLSGNMELSEFVPGMRSVPCRRSMALITYVFPFLSTITIWLLYWFYKKVLGHDFAAPLTVYSAMFFILAPNIVMLPLFYDQAIYPFVFLFLAGITILSVKNESWGFSFLSGLIIYFALFLSFSYLPILAVPIIYYLCKVWQNADKKYIWTLFKRTLLPMGAGLLAALLFLKVFINYDIVTRYQNMMTTRIEGDFYTRLGTVSQGTVSLLEKVKQIWDAALLNNIELAVAIGIPTFVFFVVMGIKSVIAVIKRDDNPVHMINVSLFLPYVMLNSIRVVLGEAGRLWMFWVPIMAMLSIQFLFPLIKQRKWVITGFVFIQVMTLFLSYQFQDYLMPQLLP